jgi:hypothetical protein
MSGAMQFHKGDIFKGEYDIFVDEVKCQEMQGESDKHHLKAMALIEKFFKSYVAGAK